MECGKRKSYEAYRRVIKIIFRKTDGLALWIRSSTPSSLEPQDVCKTQSGIVLR